MSKLGGDTKFMQETKGKAGIGVRYLGGVFFLGLGVLFLMWGLQFPIATGGVAMILMAIGLFFVVSALLLFGYNDHKRVRQGGRWLKKDWGEY
jgi:hypothetical protein